MGEISEIFKSHYSKIGIKFPPHARIQPSEYVASFFNGQKRLFFVEIGAGDPILGSNSYVLERCFDWDGLCIEPQSNLFQRILKERSCAALNCCIASSRKVVKFRQVNGYAHALSGIIDFFVEGHEERINREISKHGGSYSDIDLVSEPLTDILNKKMIRKIDYLSVDVEGAEFEVINSIDFSQFDISLIGFESNKKNETKESKIDSLLRSNDFKFLERVCGDSFYKKI